MKIIKLVIDSICLCGIEKPLKTKQATHKQTRSAVAIKYEYKKKKEEKNFHKRRNTNEKKNSLRAKFKLRY